MRKEQEFYEFTIPEIGYGSRFDYIGFESDELKLKMTEKQLVKINHWLKRHFKYIKIVFIHINSKLKLLLKKGNTIR